MPADKPHFVPGDLQFLTSNTYRRIKLRGSDRLLAAELRSAPAGEPLHEQEGISQAVQVQVLMVPLTKVAGITIL
jgi:hypothetical protein